MQSNPSLHLNVSGRVRGDGDCRQLDVFTRRMGEFRQPYWFEVQKQAVLEIVVTEIAGFECCYAKKIADCCFGNARQCQQLTYVVVPNNPYQRIREGREIARKIRSAKCNIHEIEKPHDAIQDGEIVIGEF